MPLSPHPAAWRPGMPLADAVRAARERKSMTQAQLAQRARVGLKFLYELETGKETLRSDKVLDVLEVLGLQLTLAPAGASTPQAQETRARYDVPAKTASTQPDFIGMACTSASVSLRKPLAADELVRSLLTGKVAPGKRAHFIVLLEEAPEPLLRGLVAQVGAWAAPGVVARNIRRIAAAIGVALKTIV